MLHLTSKPKEVGRFTLTQAYIIIIIPVTRRNKDQITRLAVIKEYLAKAETDELCAIILYLYYHLLTLNLTSLTLIVSHKIPEDYL